MLASCSPSPGLLRQARRWLSSGNWNDKDASDWLFRRRL